MFKAKKLYNICIIIPHGRELYLRAMAMISSSFESFASQGMQAQGLPRSNMTGEAETQFPVFAIFFTIDWHMGICATLLPSTSELPKSGAGSSHFAYAGRHVSIHRDVSRSSHIV
jgi:hypothetical protein